MLIRTETDEIVEYPDDLIAMMLAAPVVGDRGGYPDLSIEEFNCLVHGMLGMLSGDGQTLEQNMNNIREYCAMMGTPASANLEKARAQIRQYNENLKASEIGYANRATIRTVFPFQTNHGQQGEDNIIDHEPGTLPKVLPQ